jgi:hypothetical protein
MKRVATVFTVLLLLAIIGWQQYQIHRIKLQIAKLNRTAADTIELLNMQNILNEVSGMSIHGVEHLNQSMSDKLSKFEHYPSREEREKRRQAGTH